MRWSFLDGLYSVCWLHKIWPKFGSELSMIGKTWKLYARNAKVTIVIPIKNILWFCQYFQCKIVFHLPNIFISFEFQICELYDTCVSTIAHKICLEVYHNEKIISSAKNILASTLLSSVLLISFSIFLYDVVVSH